MKWAKSQPRHHDERLRARNRSRVRAAWVAAAMLAMPLAAGRGAEAGQGAAMRFPDPGEVRADFGDDAERYAALKTLFTFLQQNPTVLPPPIAAAKGAAYYNEMVDVEFKRQQQGVGPADNERFSVRVRQLLGDAKFRERVLAKYRTAAAANSSRPPAASSRDEEKELEAAWARSLPYWIGTLVAMIIAAPVSVWFCDHRRGDGGRGGAAESSQLPLPEALRVITLFGRKYAVELHSGLVVDKETATEHRFSVTATSSGPATVVGDQVFVPTPQLHTTTTITRKDCLWVRDGQGRESAWNLTNAALQARPGHVLSYVARRLREGSLEFLVVCNRTTGQVDTFDGLSEAHRACRLLPWMATTLVGAGGLFLAGNRFLAGLDRAVDARAMALPGNWIYPLLLAGFVAGVSVGLSAWVLRRLRDAAFRRRLLPAYRKFFEETRAETLSRFAAR